MSSLTRAVGGGPTFTGTAGAPAGSGSETATHGLPAADAAAADDVGEVPSELVDPPELPQAARAATDRSEAITTRREDRMLGTG